LLASLRVLRCGHTHGKCDCARIHALVNHPANWYRRLVTKSSPMTCESGIILMKIATWTFVGLSAALSINGASAAETGFAGIHEWRKEGGKTCMVDHFHYSSGTGSSRKTAQGSAVASWSSFTGFEYGSSWGRYTLAASKVMDCGQSGGGWSCSIRARPCKR